jgi:7-carboxy-7-deazaguanine synthase
MYWVKEIFYSLQGEGMRAGIPHVFVRFAGCNLDCAMSPGPLSPGGFDCDTNWKNGTSYSLESLIQAICATDTGDCGWVLFTGGEPALQVNRILIDRLRDLEYSMAIETNGTLELPQGIDWITCSPKVPPLKLQYADECKCVLTAGQPLPDLEKLPASANYLVSPASDRNELVKENMDWCMKLVMDSPIWRLSVQYHKVWKIR